MDKTRMGKRVASLLLSLVMMLSLLPTAAYATMADGVDTQGAIVSENGTGVSDDSNSSGNTDDLQVGGSSGSGTADDTTGAEGGDDPTDSANGNDSADPQDDGDAVLPVASSVVSTSEELVAAIAAASDGDTITLGAGEFTTVGNTSPEKSLTFVGAGTGTVWTIGDLDKDVGGEGNGDYSFEGCDTITFKNMTLKVDNKNYRGFIRINNTVVENCTLEGRTAYWGYETAKFVGSTFNAPGDDYALWDYSTKAMSFDSCTFNISGKGVHVYVEAANADKDVTRTVAVNNCTVNSDKANKAFLNIKNSTQAYDVTLSGTNTVSGLTANGTTGSALYQVETTKVAEDTGKPVTVKQENKAGELETVYEVKQPSANVAKVGDTEYATLDEAIAALSSNSYTLQLLDETAWNAATPVYWAAGSKSGYVATLADALTAAYKANAGGITIVCRPDANVGELTHGHVADDITIYGNNAYISSGECELEVDTYMFSRETGKQVTTGGAYLEKDITVTAYELDNLGVWGQRHTDHKVTVNLTDCDSVNGITVQRVYISGTTGVNDITLTGCDFATKATSVYSNADGAVVIDNCSFTGAQVPVNFNHKANGKQTVTVQNSTFTKCGDNGDWKQFAAPVRFVNSGSGTMDTTVGTCTFTGTVGSNGDILLGDGRVGEKSNDVKLTVENTAANVQAQQPGYYAKNGTTDESKQGTKTVAAGDKLTTSVTQLTTSSETTYVAEVKGVKYETLQAAIDAAAQNATVTLLADTRENVTISTRGLTLDLNGHTLNGGTEKAAPALTVTNRVTVKDSSAAKTGTIMREDSVENSGVSSHYVIDIQGAGWLTFESGKVTNNSGNNSGKGASLVRVGDDSIAKYPGLNIKGGTFTQDNFIVIKVDSGDLFLNGGTLNSANSYAVENWHRAAIKGGTVNGTVAAWTYSGGHNSTLTISGGTVNDNVASVSYDKAEGKVAKVSITGGTVTGTLGTYTYGNGLIPIEDPAKATIAVTGGTFSKDPSKYVVENSGVTPNGDGTFGVAKAYLAKVGDTSYYTMDEAFKAQTASGKDIVLLRDYTTGSAFPSGSINRTVDLADHTWTCTGKDANSAAFEINYPDVTLTVKNGKVVSSQLVGLIPSAMGGTIKYDNSGLVFEDVVMETSARSGIETNGNNTNDTVTLKNSTLNVPNGFGIYFPSSGTLTIDNSVINAKTMGVQVCSGSLNVSGAETAITVSGDGIPKTINDGAIEDGAAISIVNRTGYKGLSEITVKDGKFTAKGTNAAVKAYNWKDLTPSDFTQNDKVSVSGGTFSSAVDKSLCADGYIPTQNADGTYGVKEGQYVAQIGSKKYETLADAIRLATKGKTITLLADVEQNTQLTIDKSITLDLNGKTIKNTADIWGETANAILSITNGAKVTITGNGTIDAKENDYYAINMVKGDLTIENGTFYGNVSVVQVEEGTLSVKGGTFDLHQKWEGSSKYLFNCIDKAYVDGSANVAISGGTFVGFDPNVSPEQKVDGKAPSFAAPGVGITKNENGSFTAVDGMTAQILDKDGNSVKAYSTLAEAINAAQAGQTVRLLADVTLDAQIATGKAITIDGQSKYTIKAAKKLASADGKAGMFYRTQSAKGTLTFLNVTLDGCGVSKIFLNEGGAGETVFDGVTSTNGGGIAYGSGIHISGGGSHATIRNSTLTGSTGTMELNDKNYYAANDLWVGGNVYVTVENSVIGTVFVNSAPSATATNGVVHGQLTITGENTKITYLSGEEEAADKLDKFGNNGSLVKIDSGYVEKVFDKGSYAISGGTFKTKVEKEWCAAGYVPADNGNGTYGVAVGKFTVMVTSRTTGSDSPVANVAGGGSDITYAQGTKVTASAISGYTFVGWFVNEYTDTPYSTALTCEVKPTDDCTMIAVYEPISGGVFALEVSASKFTVNGGATQRSYLLEKMPIGTQVTVVFKGSENFMYWVNESGKVVSTSKTYTFSMGSATTLKAVYAEKEEHQAMVVFISHTQQVISSKGYTDTQEIQFPEPPIKMGATFVRWSMTEAEIRAAMATTATGIIVVEPVYEFNAGSYTVTVNYPNDETATYTATVGKITTVTAKSIDGKVFKCWKNGDTVLGYTETLRIAPRGDLILTAEYVDAGITVDRLPVIALTEISASQQGAKYAVSFTATRSVPEGYTVTEQGILVSTDSQYGQEGALDAMKLDANGAKPDDTFILKATNTDATGVTVLNGTVSAADRTVYGRAYMILRDSSGAMVYVYSDTILSGSYNSLTTNGGN